MRASGPTPRWASPVHVPSAPSAGVVGHPGSPAVSAAQLALGGLREFVIALRSNLKVLLGFSGLSFFL